MKKTPVKLQLKATTIRLLQDRHLTEVRGGVQGGGLPNGDPQLFAATNHPTICSGTGTKV